MMEKRFKGERDQIKIPKALSHTVKEGIKKGRRARRIKQTIYRGGLGMAASLILALCVIGVGVNTSAVFADTIYDIPVLSPIAKVMTLSRYYLSDETVELDVEIPEIKGLSDKMMENRINLEIRRKIRKAEFEIQQRAEEYRQAYLETGGDEESFRPTQAQVGYEIQSVGDQYLSFVVFQFESRASAYTQFTYYNFDIQGNREVTLRDMLGEDYQLIVNEQIDRQIQSMKLDPNNVFFDGSMGFTGIDEDQGFYINQDQQIVVCFDKYEIAPGYMGILEFPIE